MYKYLKILRIRDHPPEISFSLLPMLIVENVQAWIYWWMFAMLIFTFGAAALNEIVDKEDVDKYSWNPTHVPKKTTLNPKIVWSMIIFFSIAGLWICYRIKLFWWGFAMNTIGLLYSFKPFRLKNKYGLDILAQVLAWGFIPLAGPLWKEEVLIATIPLIISLSCILWSVFYPYQLSDFSADKKGKLKGTHILLGMRTSIYFCLLLCSTGLVLFFTNNFQQIYPWALFYATAGIYVVAFYIHWLRLKVLKEQERSMQDYAQMIRTTFWISIPYILIMGYF